MELVAISLVQCHYIFSKKTVNKVNKSFTEFTICLHFNQIFITRDLHNYSKAYFYLQLFLCNTFFRKEIRDRGDGGIWEIKIKNNIYYIFHFPHCLRPRGSIDSK